MTGFVLLFTFLFLCPSYGSSQEYVTGEIVGGFELKEQINLLRGDKTVVGLGMNQGIIKGDILSITTKEDTTFIDRMGQCAVIRVDQASSVCEVIKASREIQRGQVVFTNRLKFTQPQLYPSIYKLLSSITESYDAHKRVRVYVGSIFNEGNEVTRFSMNTRQEVVYLLGQKKKVILKTDNPSTSDFVLYPDKYQENNAALKEFMKRTGIDVFVTGSYSVRNGVVNMVLYKFDGQYGDKEIHYQIPLEGIDGAALAEVVRPYKPVEKRQVVSCEIVYKALNSVITRDMRAEVMNHEAQGDEFVQILLRKTALNIVAATDLKLKAGGATVSFDGVKARTINLTEGMNRITASFRRGYYRNETLVYTSGREETKEVIIYVRNGGNLNIDITADPGMGGKPLFNVYRRTDRERMLMRSIQPVSDEKGIELYRD